MYDGDVYCVVCYDGVGLCCGDGVLDGVGGVVWVGWFVVC